MFLFVTCLSSRTQKCQLQLSTDCAKVRIRKNNVKEIVHIFTHLLLFGGGYRVQYRHGLGKEIPP